MGTGAIFRRILWLVLILLHGAPLFAQRGSITFGAKVGVQFDSSFELRDITGQETNAFRETDYFRPAVGLAFELPLTHSISVEANALYKQERYSLHFHPGGVCNISGCHFSSVDWETHGYSLGVPLVLKIKQDLNANGQIRLFGVFGASARHSSITSSCTTSSFFIDPCLSSYSETRENYGLVFGGGVDFRKGIFHFSPELRYTRWMNDDQVWGPTEELRIKVHEFKVLFGVSVGKK
jgi:hypothetical protein